MKVYLKTRNIKKRLDEMGRPVYWLANKIEIHPSYLSALFARRRHPRPALRVLIQRRLKVQWDFIFGFDTVTAIEINDNE